MAASCFHALVGLLGIVALGVLALSPSECETPHDSGSPCDMIIASSILQRDRAARSSSFVQNVSLPEPTTGGAEWTLDDTLIVMAKLHHIFKAPTSAKTLAEEANGPYDCYTGFEDEGPQPCDGQNGNADNQTRSILPTPAKFIRLAFHDCLKYKDGTGGCDGCLRFYDQFRLYNDLASGDKRNMQRHDPVLGTNNGLALTADILELIWERGDWPPRTPTLSPSLKDSGKSRADLWSFAALVATDYAMAENNKACRGEGRCGHLYTATDPPHGCLIEPRRWLRFFSGRRDCPASDKPMSRAGMANTMTFEPSTGHRWRPYETTKDEDQPNPSGNHLITQAFFSRVFDLNTRQTVAIMGAHSLGEMHGDIGLWKYQWQWKQQHILNNNYYRLLANKPSVFIGSCDPFHVAGGPNGTLAEVAWVVRPIRKSVSAGPYLWFHSYTRCPYCYKLSNGRWVNEEISGDDMFKSEQCCVCHELETSAVPEGCLAEVTKDETMIGSDISMIHRFDVDEHGVPSGCPGFPPGWNRANIVAQAQGESRHGIDWYNTKPFCPDNAIRRSAEDEMTMADYVRLYADDQETWVIDFYNAWEKMLANGYGISNLLRGPDTLGIERCECPGGAWRTEKCVKLF